MEEYKYLIPEEAQDVVMSSVKKLRKMENNLRDYFTNKQYDEVFMPTFEYSDLYHEIPMGIEMDQLFQFFNNEGKAVALRADFTFPIARYHAHQTNEIGRYCYFGKVYRKQLSHKGRASEIFQGGIELIGLDEISGDQECLDILLESLTVLNIKQMKVELGSAVFYERLEELLDDKQGALKNILNRRDFSAMEKYIEEKSKNKKMDEKLIQFLNKWMYLCGKEEVFKITKKYLDDQILLNALTHLEKLYNHYSLKFNDLTIDLAMVPKFNYYTGLMIQGYVSNIPEALVSGGRYDRLSGVFKQNYQAIGLSYNLDRLKEVGGTE